MSQKYDPLITTPTMRKQRRTRQRRNRPVLVTTATAGESEMNSALPQTDDMAQDGDRKQETEAIPMTKAAPETLAQRVSRLPTFFSSVDKRQQEETTKKDEIVNARLARATHGKSSQGNNVLISKANTKNDAKLQSKAERREPLFKLRHFIGMTIYLFGAEFILPYEFALAHQLGLDHAFPVTIFNFTIPLSSALFLNIATLILFLYALVKLDLLPNTTSARIRAEQKAKQQQSTPHGHGNTTVVKHLPPPMRQGIKGEDDDLYQAYRANQRREKKR